MPRRNGSLDPTTCIEPLEARALMSSYVYHSLEDALALHNPIRSISNQDLTQLAGFGTVIEGLGDIDADGVPDVGIAAPGVPPAEGGFEGFVGGVYLYSGRTGEFIRTFSDGATGFGADLANLGDVNADGIPDLLVGSPGFDGTDDEVINPTGRVYIYSGADGSVLRTIEGPAPDTDFGRTVSRLNDADSDGVQDIIIGAPGRVAVFPLPDAPNPSTPGQVFIFSGADGSLIRSHAGVNAADNFGRAIAVAGDEGDDRHFYAIGAHGFDGAGEDAGRVYVYTLDGALAYTLDGERAGDLFGTSIVIAPNIAVTGGPAGGDHRLVVGAPGSDYGVFADQPAVEDRGRVESFNLADGTSRVIGEAADAIAGSGFGAGIGLVADLDFNGADDISVRGHSAGMYFFSAALDAFQPFPSTTAPRKIGGLFAASMEALGDVNGDGIPDLVGATLTPETLYPVSVRIYSSLGFGPSVKIAGTSDNLRYMWSQQGRPVLFIDGVARAFDHVPGLAMAAPGDVMSPTSLIQGIGNDGAIYFVNESSAGVSPLMVLRDGTAVTLESLVAEVVGQPPADYDVLRVTRVGSGGHVLLTDASAGMAGATFVFADGVLTSLWAGSAHDVNASGTVVGVRVSGTEADQAVMWTSADGVAVIPELTESLGINDDGVIVGVRTGTNTQENPGVIALWDDGVVTDLGGRPDAPGVSIPSWTVVDFENDGRVLLLLLTPAHNSGTITTFLYDSDDGLRPLAEATHEIPDGVVFGSVTTLFTHEFNPSIAALASDGRIVAYDAILTVVTQGELGVLREGSPVTSITVGGVRYVAGINQYDEVVIFRYDGNSWSVRRIDAAVTDQTQLQLVADPGGPAVLAVTGNGSVHVYDAEPGGAEEGYLLSTEGRSVIERGLTTFTNKEGVVHLAGFDADGNVVIYYRNPAGAIQGGWNYDNLSQNHLAPRGIATPNIVSNLTAYATSWSGMNLAGIDEQGHIVAIWWSPESVFWQVADLSASVIGPFVPYVGELTAFVTDWDTLHINGTNSMGRVRALWWAPGFGGAWRDQPLPTVFVDSDSMTSFVTPWGGLNLVARTSGEVGATVVFWWTPETNDWLVNNLPSMNTFVTLEGRISAYVETGTIVTQNIYGRRDDGSLMRMSWRPAETIWTLENVTQELG